MNNYYFDFYISIDDIKDFLQEKKVAWSGVVKSKSRPRHIIDYKDLYLLLREPLELEVADGNCLTLSWADGLSFNCSSVASKKDWRLFLLKKYGKTYAQCLYNYLQYEKTKLRKIYQDRLQYNINLIKGMESKNPVLTQTEIDVMLKSMKKKLNAEYKEEVANKFSFFEAEIEKVNNKMC